MQACQLKSKLCWLVGVLIGLILVGCGPRENRDIMVARQAIVLANMGESDKYDSAQKSIDSALASNPDLIEAQCLKRILALRTDSSWSTDITKWRSTVGTVRKLLSGVVAEIQRLEVAEDPDSDQLDQLDMLIRNRNSVYGLTAYGLAGIASGNTSIADETEILRALLEAERCYDDGARSSAFKAIDQLGSNARSSLLEILASQTTPEIRQFAVNHLGKLKDPTLIETFKQILANKAESAQVLYSAIIAIEKIGTPEIIPALKVATRANPAIVRMHAAKLINRLDAVDTTEDLLFLLADSDTYTKDMAIDTLTQLGQSTIPHLSQTLNQHGQNIVSTSAGEHRFIANAFIDDVRISNRRNAVQRAVLQVLGNLKTKSVISDLVSLLEDDDLKGGAKNALISMGGTVVPQLIETCQDSGANSSIRIGCAQALLSIKDLRATEPLIDLLVDPQTPKEIQAIAAQFMGVTKSRGNNQRAIDALGQSLSFDDTTATQAALALGQIKVKDNIVVNDKLIDIAEDFIETRDAIRQAAINAVGKMKLKDAIQPLMRLALNDTTSLELRKAAVTALGVIENNVKISVSADAMLWGLNTRFDDPNKLRRHMKREYSDYGNLKKQIEGLGIEWLSEEKTNPEAVDLSKWKRLSERYKKPEYESWGKIKPVPSLIRSEMALALGKIGKRVTATSAGRNIVRELIEALHHKRGDERATVRANSARALGIIGEAGKRDAQVIDQIVKALTQSLEEDKQGLVRQAAATALGKVEKSDKVANVLLKAITQDKFESTRTSAVNALASFNSEISDRGLVKVLKKGIGSFEDDKKEVASIQARVIVALLIDGADHTAEALINACRSTEAKADEWVKWATVSTLGGLAKPNSYETILDEMKNENYRVRKTAVSVIGNFKKRGAVTPLIQILNNPEESKSIRANAAGSLGNLRDERAIKPLLATLGDPSAATELQEAAVKALQAMEVKPAITPILSLLQNPQSPLSLRLACVTALGMLGDHSETREQVTDAVKDIFRNQADEIYERAIIALGQLQVTEMTDDLLAIVKDRGATAIARKNAASALAELDALKATSVLAKRLIDETEYFIELDIDSLKRNYTWEHFVTATQDFEMPDAISSKMIQRIEDTWEHNPIRHAAILALGRSNGPQATAKLDSLLREGTNAQKQFAFLAIGRSKRKRFLSQLIAVIKSDAGKDMRRNAIQALGVLGDKATTSDLLAILSDESDHEIRQDAAVALTNIGDLTAVPALIDKLKNESDKGVQLSLMDTLANTVSDQSISTLETFLQSDDADFHFLAARALNQITGKSYGYEW
ncbi:MAG: HEAT repeat domain-containing protein [Candidatus Poribacteria bacterium]|nr:HEAT repeat domain-containing protein [Candidatus Poribacteria bacterium]MDP6747169.1 HEAT repeat domain-containing protein [Candidatus Poribacteria bacterium]MDP6997261.1 HEAT repeat domain-containing protein [Candidatus Poribacteria bacterium]